MCRSGRLHFTGYGSHDPAGQLWDWQGPPQGQDPPSRQTPSSLEESDPNLCENNKEIAKHEYRIFHLTILNMIPVH